MTDIPRAEVQQLRNDMAAAPGGPWPHWPIARLDALLAAAPPETPAGEPERKLRVLMEEITRLHRSIDRLRQERDAKLHIGRIRQGDRLLQIVALHDTPNGIYVEVR